MVHIVKFGTFFNLSRKSVQKLYKLSPLFIIIYVSKFLHHQKLYFYISLLERRIHQKAMYIQKWLICGPFPNKDTATRLSKDYLYKEELRLGKEGEYCGGKKWELYESPSEEISLLALNIPVKTNCVMYCCCYIFSPEDMDVNLHIGSDDGVSVWIDDTRVHYNDVYRMFVKDQDRVTTKIKRGWSRILVKITQGEGDWKFSFKITDTKNKEVPISTSVSLPENLSQHYIPPKVVIRNINIDDKFYYLENGIIGTQMKLNILNVGTDEEIKNCKVELLAEKNNILHSEEIAQILPGRDKEISCTLSLKEISSICSIGLQVKIGINDIYETQNFIPESPIEVVKQLFSPILIKRWQLHKAENDIPIEDINFLSWETFDISQELILPPTKVLFLKRQISLLKEFDGFSVKLNLGTENKKFIEKVYINNSEVEYNDEIEISKYAKEDRTLTILVKFSSAKGNASGTSEEKRLKFSPSLNLYRDDIKEFLSLERLRALLDDPKEYDGAFETIAKDLLNAFNSCDIDLFSAALSKYRNKILPLREKAKEDVIYLIGNSHIDMAWLWPWTETVEVCKNTFQQALDFIDEYEKENFSYAQSQAQAYLWMEELYPEIFERIKQAVEKRRWEIVGGMWVESDANLPSGESLVRQFLYGKRYFKEKFNIDVKVAWLPDTFGFCWTLPQIMKKSGIECFMTTKIFWNDTNMFPYNIFFWRGLDGTQILTYMPFSYCGAIEETSIIKDLKRFKQRNNNFQKMAMLYGTGDHGGGPTRENIETIKRLSQLSLYPTIKLSTFREFLGDIKEKTQNLPIWDDELYLEYHRGTYTTQAKVKKYNRYCEILLSEAEMLNAICTIMCKNYNYPKNKFLSLWRKLLFNQFHDILAGSSIRKVYEDAEEDYRKIISEGNELLTSAIECISNSIKIKKDTNRLPVVIFNPLPWERSGWVEYTLQLGESYRSIKVETPDGTDVPTQLVSSENNTYTFGWIAKNIPPLGYMVYYIIPLENSEQKEYKSSLKISTDSLENQFYRVEIDPLTGDVTSIFDKINQKEFIPKELPKGNYLQIFEDMPKAFDAWEIDKDFEKIYWDIEKADSIKIIEGGPLRCKLEIKKSFNNSKFIQNIVLYDGLPIVEFPTQVEWNEKHKLLKVMFPVNLYSEKCAFEIPYGYIYRSTKRETLFEQARFEVSGHKWIDYSDGEYGFSILNNCKYGYDVKNNILRMTLLRAPTDPDPHADEGFHEFTYAIYTHKYDFKKSETILHSYNLNCPLIVKSINRKGISNNNNETLPEKMSFLEISPANVIVSVMKQHEDKDTYILRLYEAAGEETLAKLSFPWEIKSAKETNLLEADDEEIRKNSQMKFYKNEIELFVKPNEIKTLEIEFLS